MIVSEKALRPMSSRLVGRFFYLPRPRRCTMLVARRRRRPTHHRELMPTLRIPAARVSLAAAALVLSASSVPLAAQSLAFPGLAADAPAGAGRVEPCTAPALAGTARCGRFRVLEDRERRDGRTIDIAFVILDATDAAARAEDAVTLLPGGPGETFTDRAVPISVAMAAVRRTRDVLLVDVRGVGRSQPLDCDVPYPGGLRSRFGTVFPLAHALACRDALSRRADLSQYTTASSVDDLEALRAWLGYPLLNLMGASYGTRVAQVYMARYPQSVRSAVLNGVAPIAEPLYVQHARLLQRALDRVLADCAADAACAREHPGLGRSLERVLSRFRAGPVTVELDGERVPFSLGDLSYALRGLLYGRAGDVPRLVAAAAAGNVRPLAQYYVERTEWVGARGGSGGYHFSVLCAEDVAPLSDDDVARETAGTFMGAHLIDGYRAVCAQWPYSRLPASHWVPVRSDVPTLLLSGGRDPVTPPEGGDAVARHLETSLHVVVPAGGHGVGGPCIQRMILHVIETASVSGVDTSCVPAATAR
jgi:pimeloyl-ACP methyl ester carboxylesterase